MKEGGLLSMFNKNDSRMNWGAERVVYAKETSGECLEVPVLPWEWIVKFRT